MADILHRVGIKSPVEKTYQALATRDGLASWWTTGTSGQSKIGGILEFRFGAGGFDMKVLGLDPGRHVLWEVVDGPAEWIGTRVRWDLRQEDDYAIVLLKHEGWREPVVGGVPAEPETAPGDGPGRTGPGRRQDRQLELTIAPLPVAVLSGRLEDPPGGAT